MDNKYILTSDGQLYHWGIKGMKWGVRRYQNADGSLTKAGKSRYDEKMSSIKAKTEKVRAKQEAKQAKQDRKDALKAAKQELADAKKGKKRLYDENGNDVTDKIKKKDIMSAEEIDTVRQKILSNPTAKEVLANRHLFNDREIQCIRLRLQEEKMIESMLPAEIDKGQQFVDKFTKKSTQISSVIEGGSKAWNSIAKLHNSLFSGKTGVELPMISDKVKSKAEKIKEEAELLEAKNKLKKAKKDDPDRPKTDDEKYAEETTKINAQVARQSAENKLREARNTKAKMDADDSETKRQADEAARKTNEDRSRKEYEKGDSTYNSKARERTSVNPNENRGLSLYNPTTTSLGKTYAETAAKTNTTDVGLITKIRNMTNSGNKTNAEIADQLGISTSTVSKYSNGRDEVERLMSYDENGRFVGYWSAIRMDDD